MGSEVVHIEAKILATVSRHLSPQDDADDELVEDIRRRLEEFMQNVIDDPRYASLRIMRP